MILKENMQQLHDLKKLAVKSQPDKAIMKSNWLSIYLETHLMINCTVYRELPVATTNVIKKQILNILICRQRYDLIPQGWFEKNYSY